MVCNYSQVTGYAELTGFLAWFLWTNLFLEWFLFVKDG